MTGTQKKMQTAENSFIERLAEKIGVSANAKFIYGEPVERDGVTVIPVAKAVYGFGGGSGGKKDAEEGSGGGGGVVLKPVGYIEIKNGKTRFRPMRDWLQLFTMLAAAPAILFTGWKIAGSFGRKADKRDADVAG